MKKLNITKKQYEESKYFNKKYGALKFVSESGKLYKTDKGVVIALESIEDFKADDEGKKDGDEPTTGGDEGGENKGGDSADVTRGELTEMLKDVVAEVETVCDKQDLSFEEVAGIEKPEGESEEADADEVVATKDEVAEVLAGVIEKVTDIAEKNSVELPLEIEKKDDEEDGGEGAGDGDGEGKIDDDDKDDLRDGEFQITDEESDVCPKCGAKMKKECGDGMCESARKAKRAKLVREAIARRRRARKIRESIQKRIRARKVMESIRARRRAKVMESIRKRRAAKRVIESKKRVARKVK